MAEPQGLLTGRKTQTVIQIVTVAGTALICLGYIGLLLAGGRPLDPGFIHSLTIILIAVATYVWVALPFGVGIAVSLLASLVTLWAWAAVRSALLGIDVLALGVLIGAASLRQRRDRRRAYRLQQKLNDLGEELYLKEQAVQLGTKSHDALQYKTARYQQLQTIAEQLSRLVELEAIAQLAVDRAFELIGKSDVCLLFLVDKDRQELALYASHKGSRVTAIRQKQGDQFDRYVLRTQRPLLVHDISRDFRFSDASAPDRPMKSVVACPVRVGQAAEGVLRLDSAQPSAYTQDDLRFLDILLDLVDAAIANARLFAQTQQLALTDGLTGLYRREPCLDQLAREVARASRNREPLSVAMIDLDNFKRYNDTLGHSAGDLVLKEVARIIRDQVPSDGIAARYGGEEFAVLLPKVGREQAAVVAEQIRRAVEERVHVLGQAVEQPVTASIGIAAFPDDGQSELELIRRADQRLYQAKRTGKNRVCSS